MCPILCRFRKKVPFDLFGWTACWSKSFKADLSSWICMKALLQNRTSQQARRNWITLPPDSTKLKSGSDFWRHFGVSCHTRSGSPARRLFNRNFVGLFDGRGQSHYTVYALIVLCLVSTVWLWAGPVRGSGFAKFLAQEIAAHKQFAQKETGHYYASVACKATCKAHVSYDIAPKSFLNNLQALFLMSI